MWRRVTRKAVPERSGITRQTLSGLGIEHQRCVRILSRTRGVIRASHVQGLGNMPLQPRSRINRLRAIPISWCRSVFTFLASCLCVPRRASGNMPVFFGTGPTYRMRRSLGPRPNLSFAQPGDIFVGFARRRPPRPLCSTPPQEAVAGGSWLGPGSVLERCLICMAL